MFQADQFYPPLFPSQIESKVGYDLNSDEKTVHPTHNNYSNPYAQSTPVHDYTIY